MSAHPVKDFLLRKAPLDLWMVLFLFAGGMVLGAFLPDVGLAAGAGIFIGTAALLFLEKKLAEDKKKEEEKEAKA